MVRLWNGVSRRTLCVLRGRRPIYIVSGHMRILLHSFLAGLGAIALVSVLGYFIRPGGDTHLGPFIYVVLAVVYFVCHIFGTVVANLCPQGLVAIGSRSFLALSVS